MQLPSLYHVAAEAGQVARRFPLTLLCAIALCVAGCPALTYVNSEAQHADWAFPLGSAVALGMHLLVAAAPYLLSPGPGGCRDATFCVSSLNDWL